MKFVIYRFFLSALIVMPFLGHQLEALTSNDHFSENISHQRVYIKAENLIVGADSIHVIINHEVIPITQINIDENGLYFEVNGKVPVGTWECPSCGCLNTWFTNSCEHCGWPDK